jgi:hypothetical protein
MHRHFPIQGRGKGAVAVFKGARNKKSLRNSRLNVLKAFGGAADWQTDEQFQFVRAWIE